MTTLNQYSEIFNRLCHMVALTKDGKVDKAIDSLILTLFGFDETFLPESAPQIKDGLNVYFNLDIDVDRVQPSIDRLIHQGSLIRDQSSNILHLSPYIKSSIQQEISDAHQIEKNVQEEWFKFINIQHEDLTPENYEQLWCCLQTYMGKAFYRHGIETIQLLDPNIDHNDVHLKFLSTYLQESIEECCDETTKPIATIMVSGFFTRPLA